MRALGPQPPAQIAFIDVSENTPDGRGTIRPVVLTGTSEESVTKLLDDAKAEIEAYMTSGAFDAERENQRLARLLAQHGISPSSGNPIS